VRGFRAAAELAHAQAQAALGDCLVLGDGSDQDYAEVAKWFRSAAEQGDARAQFSLGFLFYFGDGVSRDYAEAVRCSTTSGRTRILKGAELSCRLFAQRPRSWLG
jgi:uncharacterized protein